MVTWIKQFKTSVLLLALMTGLTGIIYPLAITLFAQTFYPWEANGSLVMQDDKLIGSMLIGQLFESPDHFWGRPSATSPTPYNGASSSASNLGSTNPDFIKQLKQNAEHLRIAHPHQSLIPVDLVTSSGSGLDPDISLIAAYYQVDRVARANHLSVGEVNQLVFVNARSPGRVNVLALNLALDTVRKSHVRRKA